MQATTGADGDRRALVAGRWRIAVDDVPASGYSSTLSADEAEREALAVALEVPGCDDLVCGFTIVDAGRNRFHLAGTLRARLRRTSVISLEAMQESIDEPLEAEFWPSAQIESAMAEPEDEMDRPEPIENGMIDVGALVFETLSVTMAAHPRRTDESMEWREDDDGSDSPFAALGSLKSGS